MLLEANNIIFRYDRRKSLVIDNMNLRLSSGERAALVGPSGCGKSTLSHILAGNLKPQSGVVTIDGMPLNPKIFCPVQLVYQHPEKALNPRWKLGKSLSESWNPGDVFLANLGIEKPWLDRYPAELSGGELQRFCIARALNPLTKFIIADEISTMLDVVTQAQIWELLLRICKDREIGLLAVTHNAALASRVCERVIEFPA